MNLLLCNHVTDWVVYLSPPLHPPPLLQLFVVLAVVQSEATATVLDSACEYTTARLPQSLSHLFVLADEYPQSVVYLVAFCYASICLFVCLFFV